MTLPTLDKTGGAAWQFNVNQDVGGTGVLRTDCADLLYKIKQALKTFGSMPWAVWGSSDSVGAGNNDSNDRWTYDATYTKLVWVASTGVHSWIVLEQAGLGGAQVCIDLIDATLANTYNCTLVFSPGGNFGAVGSGGTGADGTTSVRPTAGDEITVISVAAYGASTAAFYSKGLHVMQSSDGQCTRVLFCRDNATPLFWIFDKAKNPIAAWTSPYMVGMKGASGVTEVCTYANFNDAASLITKYGTTSVTNYMTSAFYVSGSVGENQTYPDDNTNEWPINSIGLASLTAAHRGGRKGEVFDLWWGSTGAQIGTTYPETGTKLFAQFGHLIFPWNGTTPKTA